MNVMILAGGTAKRLWPLTEDLPKALLPLAGSPVLYHLLENLAGVEDVRSITIAIDRDKEDYFKQLQNPFDTRGQLRPLFSVHDLTALNTPMEPLAKLQEILRDSTRYGISGDDFLVVGADNVFGFSLNEFCRFYRESGIDCVAIKQVGDPPAISPFGVPTIDSLGRIEHFEEKPERQYPDQVSTACYCFKRRTLERLDEYLTSGHCDNLGYFIAWLVGEEKVNSYAFEHEWFDVGTPKDLLAANAFVINSKPGCQTDPSLQTKRTRVQSPVWLGPGVLIQDSVIRSVTSIGAESTITHSRIENSIILEGCTIHHCTLSDSIIGRGSVVTGNVSDTVLGSESRIARQQP